MRAAEFAETFFSSESKPDLRTVRAAVLRGEIQGRIMLGMVFVDVEHFERTSGHALADRILERISPAA